MVSGMEASSSTDLLLTGSGPVYLRVYQRIAEAIESGALRPGDPLPPERALCERLSVSRATVRRALRKLTENGLIESSVGRGSFVAGGPIGEPPNTLLSFTELAVSRGLTPSARVLSRTVRPATLDEAESFGIAAGADIFELERLRMLDGLPVSVDRYRIPLAYAPFLAETDFTSASLYATLEANGVRPPTRAEWAVEALAADSLRAELLGVSPGAPLLRVRGVGYDTARKLIEQSETVYRGDRYRFRATLVRPIPVLPT
jgi:GntR family transcriptional regulator